MRLIDGDALTKILEGERDYHERTGFTDRANGVINHGCDFCTDR